MQRVSDLPFRTCLPARAPPRPLGHRPSSSPHGREEAGAAGGGRAAGVRTEGARLGWPARRGRVRAGGGGVPARERGRGWVCLASRRPGGRGCRAGSGSPVEGPREDTRERPAPLPSSRSCLVSGPAVARSTSARSASAVRHHSSACWPPRNRPRSIKRSPKRVCAVIWTTVAYNRSHVKKYLTSLFLTSAKILLRVPLAQFHSSKL